jgi:hypothetical protein
MSPVISIKRKVTEAVQLLSNREYFHLFSRLCANCLPSSLALLNKSHIMALSVPSPITVVRPSEVLVRRACPADLTRIMECSQDDSSMASLELFQRYFQSGHACYVIEQSEKILAYCWVFFERYCIVYDGCNRSKMYLRLRPHSVFVGNVFVNPANRRQGLYSCMLNAIVSEQYASRKIGQVLVAVKASNSVSLAAHKNRGFRMTCTLYYLATPPLTCLVAVTSGGRTRICWGKEGKAIEYERLCGQPFEVDPNL